MSSSLLWKPVVDSKTILPDELKFKLKDLGLLPIEVSNSHNIDVFKILASCDVKGAKEVLSAVEEHNRIYIFEEW